MYLGSLLMTPVVWYQIQSVGNKFDISITFLSLSEIKGLITTPSDGLGWGGIYASLMHCLLYYQHYFYKDVLFVLMLLVVIQKYILSGNAFTFGQFSSVMSGHIKILMTPQ